MIKFSLQCSNGHGFEAWFPDSDSFGDQQGRGLVTCPQCNDANVQKTIMAPNVKGGKGRATAVDAAPKLPTTTPPQDWGPEQVAAARQFFHAVRATVKKTHEDVGDKFADEARAIHEGKKPDRGILGKASKEQVDSLLDDGIEVLPLPDVKLDG